MRSPQCSYLWKLLLAGLLAACSSQSDAPPATTNQAGQLKPTPDPNETDSYEPTVLADKGEWTTLLNQHIQLGPVFGLRSIYVGTTDGKIIALSATDGAKKWETNLKLPFANILYVVNGIILTVNQEGHIYGLKEVDGSIAWHMKATFPPDVDLKTNVYPPFDIVKNNFIYGDQEGYFNVHQIKTGVLKFRNKRTLSPKDQLLSIKATMNQWQEPIVYYTFRSFHKENKRQFFQGVYRTGFPENRKNITPIQDPYLPPVAHDGMVFKTDNQANGTASHVIAHNEFLDDEVWRTDPMNETINNVPQEKGGMLYYCGSFKKGSASQLFAHDIADGSWVWGYQQEEAGFCEPVITGDILLIGNQYGQLKIFNRKDGNLVTAFKEPGGIQQIIAIPGQKVAWSTSEKAVHVRHLFRNNAIQTAGLSIYDGDSELQTRINKAKPGDTLFLDTMEYEGTFTIINKKKLTLMGVKDSTTLFTYDRTADVLYIDSSYQIAIHNINLLHKVPTECVASVINIQNSGRIRIDSCDIHGSGAYGVTAYSDSVRITNNYIHDCSYWGIEAGGEGMLITGNSFYKNGGEEDGQDIFANEYEKRRNRIYGNTFIPFEGDGEGTKHLTQKDSTEQSAPNLDSLKFKWEDYPVAISPDPVFPHLDFSKVKLTQFLQDKVYALYGDRPTINFGGKYMFVSHGCGSGCQASYIIDVFSGLVREGPAAAAGYEYQPDSELLVVNPRTADAAYFRFKNGNLIPLKKI